MKEKVLYVSDLDGTLLNSRGVLSEFTSNVINELTKEGMLFSYATARSAVTARRICKNLKLNDPVIVHNGIFITDNSTGEIIHGFFLTKEEADYILDILNKNSIYPFVHTMINEEERISYCKDYLTVGMIDFVNERKNDKRMNETALNKVNEGNVFHFTCIDEEDKLLKVKEILENEFQCIYYKDIYSEKMWLEIFPKNVTKGNSILKLKKILKCDKIVCFGDGENDRSMFSVADECYAMKNGEDAIKNIATGVIDSNDNNGVAKWLKDNFKTQ